MSSVGPKTIQTTTLPASIYLIGPTRVLLGNSPTCYDLPLLNASPTGNVEPLPTIRPHIDSSAKARRPELCIAATYRNVVPPRNQPFRGHPYPDQDIGDR
ncbi:unnamed protein product [Fusarium graminearum]|uniref:Chromosome 2, complete genome n=2 Tax=Gibberella zeae (strain ATCC MYA-4620 / CBS 123657 / FGSC 9075 / NRRL 31084 / PH-1) TaxID=229533 RepID=A0A098DD94_GIBZE|nr:unnamed protein product [Fusarium graminearum]CZS80229.1 unnamed protein product [Fusarium graminearum]